MVDSIDSVNDILVHLAQARKAYEERGNRERAIEMSRYEADLRAHIRDYERMEAITRPVPIINGDDLSDLPPELLSELSATKTDELESQIVTTINVSGGVADIDAILILLFRRFKVVQTRRFLQNKLWRMTQKEIIHSVEGKKGSYSTRPISALDNEDESPHETDGSTTDFDDSIPF